MALPNGDLITTVFDPQMAYPVDKRMQVDTLNSRDSMSMFVRWEGMRVYVLEDSKLYILQGGRSNEYWKELGTGSGTGGTTFVGQFPTADLLPTSGRSAGDYAFVGTGDDFVQYNWDNIANQWVMAEGQTDMASEFFHIGYKTPIRRPVIFPLYPKDVLVETGGDFVFAPATAVARFIFTGVVDAVRGIETAESDREIKLVNRTGSDIPLRDKASGIPPGSGFDFSGSDYTWVNGSEITLKGNGTYWELAPNNQVAFSDHLDSVNAQISRGPDGKDVLSGIFDRNTGEEIIFKEGSTTPDPDGVVEINVFGKYFVRSGIEEIKAEWYGISEGLADNRGSLQIGINTAAAMGLPFRIPEGVYNIKENPGASGPDKYLNIPSNSRIYGRGVGITVIIDQSEGLTGGAIFSSQDQNNISVSNLTVDGNEKSYHNFLFRECLKVVLARVESRNSTYHGIHFNIVNEVWADKVFSHHNGRSGLGPPYERGAGIKASYCRAFKTTDSIYEFNAEHGIYAASDDVEGDHQAIGCTSRKNGVPGTRRGAGLSIRARNTRIIGCHVFENFGQGISNGLKQDEQGQGTTPPDSYIISGCTVWDNGKAGDSNEISLMVDKATITGNIITGGISPHLLQINGVNDVIISSNVIEARKNETATLIRLSAGLSRAKIDNNILNADESISFKPRGVRITSESKTDIFEDIHITNNLCKNLEYPVSFEDSIIRRPVLINNKSINQQGSLSRIYVVGAAGNMPTIEDPLFISTNRERYNFEQKLRLDVGAFLGTDNARILEIGDTESPEGIVTATTGSLYIRTGPGGDDRIYVKSSGSASVGWRLLQTVRSGSSAGRPNLDNIPIGYSYFDTNLGRPIWKKNSTTWSDIQSVLSELITSPYNLTNAPDGSWIKYSISGNPFIGSPNDSLNWNIQQTLGDSHTVATRLATNRVTGEVYSQVYTLSAWQPWVKLSNADTFNQLSDTPASKTGNKNKTVKVSDDETAHVYVADGVDVRNITDGGSIAPTLTDGFIGSRLNFTSSTAVTLQGFTSAGGQSSVTLVNPHATNNLTLVHNGAGTVKYIDAGATDLVIAPKTAVKLEIVGNEIYRVL